MDDTLARYRTGPEAGVDVDPAGIGESGVATSVVKRLVDLMFACAALLLFLPLFSLVGLAIRIETGASALVTQRRTGRSGRAFTLYRFRTSTDVNRFDDSGAATLTGRMLLMLSLDEAPQIWNILRGDMSLVGPRPHTLDDDIACARVADRYQDRFRARPGLTGLAQVSGLRGLTSNHALVRDRVAADNHYIENWSLGLDLAILARTISIVFRDRQP